MSLIKKNLKATKGKKRWRRNIDVSEMLEEVHNKKQEEKLEKEVKDKLKNKSLYFIDEKPEGASRKREPLDPNRFKKKVKDLTKTEVKAISKLSQKMQRKEDQKNERIASEVQDLDTNNTSSDEEDVWNPKLSQVAPKRNLAPEDVKIPAVLLPHEGQSYNPTYKSHSDLLKIVVDEEIKKDKKKEHSDFVRRKPASTIKSSKPVFSKKERREAREKSQRRQERKVEHDFMYLKKVKREVDEEVEKHNEAYFEKQKAKEEEKALVEAGKIHRPKKVNRNVYHPKDTDFQLPEELKPNLRTLNPAGDLLKDRFDSVFRRNLIDKTSFGQKKKKPRRMAKYKWHRTDRTGRDDNDDMVVHK